jgi:hypothetical protein
VGSLARVLRLTVCAAGVAVLLVLVVAGCRQLVGIGDWTQGSEAGAGGEVGDTGADGCGLAMPTGSCASCVASQCCGQAEACAQIPLCKSIEECFARCAGDVACNGTCKISFPQGALAQFLGLETCLATNCWSECSMPCGSRLDDWGPDAGACSTCIQSKVCPQVTACATSIECETVSACEGACSTVDCAAACYAASDAGTALFTSVASGLANCAAPCLLGQAWSCVGHVAWPRPTMSQNTVAFRVIGVVDHAPVADASVTLCPNKQDPRCLPPEDTQQSDADGGVILSYTVDPLVGGLDSYAEITRNDILPTLFYWDFPLSVQHAELFEVNTLTQLELTAELSQFGFTPQPGHGHIGVAARDCVFSGAVGVQVRTSLHDAFTLTLYQSAEQGLTPDAGGTDGTGVALIANVPAGLVTIDVLAPGIDKPVSSVLVTVRDGWAHQVIAVPTPQ